MGAEGAVRILRRARDPRRPSDPAAVERGVRRRSTASASSTRTGPPTSGQIDEVIEPRETRPRLIRALEILRTKVQQNPPQKHGLIPVVAAGAMDDLGFGLQHRRVLGHGPRRSRSWPLLWLVLAGHRRRLDGRPRRADARRPPARARAVPGGPVGDRLGRRRPARRPDALAAITVAVRRPRGGAPPPGRARDAQLRCRGARCSPAAGSRAAGRSRPRLARGGDEPMRRYTVDGRRHERY